MPHHVGVLLRGEEDAAGGAEGHDVAHLGAVDAAETVVVQPVLEPAHGDDGLRLEGGGALDDAAAGGHGEREQEEFDVGG